MNWYLEAFRNYADFSGRARRKEYWMFMLFHIIIVFLFLIPIIGIMVSAEMNGGSIEESPLFIAMCVLAGIYYLATLIPTYSISCRRLHDVGMSGWWILTGNIPYVGVFFGIFLLVKYCTDGDMGENQFGMNPKEDEDLAVVFN